MKEKEKYTFEELCDNLKITVSEFCRRAEITEGTLARIRKGYSARRSTINKMLDTFSQIYDRELSLDNVTGIHPLGTSDDDESMADLTATSYGTAQVQSAQNRPSRRKKGIPLPEGCVTVTEFARRHGINPITFRDHILVGLGRGEKEKVEAEERPKPGREKEIERYLTPAQQTAALAFWSRHGVQYQASTVQGGSTGDVGEDIDPAA